MKGYMNIEQEISARAKCYAFEQEGLKIGNIVGERQETTGTTMFAAVVRGLFAKWCKFEVKPIMSCHDVDLAFYHNDGTYAVVEAKCWSKKSEYIFNCCQYVKREDRWVYPSDQVEIEFNTWANRLERRFGVRPVASSFWITDGDFLGKVTADGVIGAYASTQVAQYYELLKELVGFDVVPNEKSFEDNVLYSTLDTVFELNEYFHMESVSEGKLGQNFTPAKTAYQLVKRALPWVEEMFNNGEYEALAQRIVRTKIFDPSCGDGAILVAAYKRLSLYLNACNEKLGSSYVYPKTNLYGIEIDYNFATKCMNAINKL